MDHVIVQTDDQKIDAFFATVCTYHVCRMALFSRILYLSLLSVSAIGINPLCSFKHFKGLNKKKKKLILLTSEIT